MAQWYGAEAMTRTWARWIGAMLFGSTLMWGAVAHAHEFDPHIARVIERAEGEYAVRWTAPGARRA